MAVKKPEITGKIAVVISTFNEEITGRLLKGALKALKDKNIKSENILIFRVPGAFEIPLITETLAKKAKIKKIEGIITLGCVIKGETAHFEYISNSVSINLNRISSVYSIPVGFGILTCYDVAQAYERSRDNPPDSDNNKGYETALAVLETIETLKKLF
ncbi:MAG: 6,7-dimethyl-8-ribityllumazine synthase [Ignavibacteria bacterium]|nr:6,7-dimethyl-8-ribityllumazine synthase [Ignavibacteria bacterium]